GSAGRAASPVRRTVARGPLRPPRPAARARPAPPAGARTRATRPPDRCPPPRRAAGAPPRSTAPTRRARPGPVPAGRGAARGRTAAGPPLPLLPAPARGAPSRVPASRRSCRQDAPPRPARQPAAGAQARPSPSLAAGRLLSSPQSQPASERFAMPLSPNARQNPAPGAPEAVPELTWEVFAALCRALAVKGANSRYTPDLVGGIAKAGVSRGAVIASILDCDFSSMKISRHAGTERVRAQPRILSAAPRDAAGRRVLIVDEICTTGATLRLALAAVRNVNPADV